MGVFESLKNTSLRSSKSLANSYITTWWCAWLLFSRLNESFRVVSYIFDGTEGIDRRRRPSNVSETLCRAKQGVRVNMKHVYDSQTVESMNLGFKSKLMLLNSIRAVYSHE